MKIENLPTLDLAFFNKESESITLAQANGCRMVINCKIDEVFNDNFVLDSKSFEMAKKLCTNRKFEKFENKIKITSKEGNLIVPCLDTPNNYPYEVNNIEYACSYNVRALKEASKFVANTGDIFSGVIVNNHGDIISTDKYKFYYLLSENVEKRENTKTFSIPLKLIDLLNPNEVDAYLELNETKVMYKSNDMRIVANLYAGTFPNVSNILASTGETYSIPVNEALELFSEGEILNVKIDAENVIYEVEGNEKTFQIEDKHERSIEQPNEFNVSYKNWILAVKIVARDKDHITLNINKSLVKLNNKVILCQVKK